MSNIFLDESWQKEHLEKIKNIAGPRYTPELNIELPISEIFDGICRTREFCHSIREHCGMLMRAFGGVSGNYENYDAREIYKEVKDRIFEILKTLSQIRMYDSKKISWDEIEMWTRESNHLLSKLSSRLREEKINLKTRNHQEGQEIQYSYTEKISEEIHSIYETQKELKYFNEFSSSTKAKLSNSPFLLLTGVAGTGKTHLLCDIVENRVKRGLPAVLVFGELFTTNEEPFSQMIRQLGLNKALKKLNKSRFLKLLNSAGRRSGCRAILAIDALNETRQRNFWKSKLKRIVDEIKKYPHIALVVSVRTGFVEEVIPPGNFKKAFIHEEHRGFEFKEWEATKRFFEEFQLPLPEIPLLIPEFQNPLFLFLFCKAYHSRARDNKGKKERQFFRGHEGATYIFESFVDGVSKKIAKQFNIPNRQGKNIWDSIIEKIAERMVEKGTDRISENELVALVKKEHPSIDHKKLIKELERNLLIVKVPKYSKKKYDYDGFDFRFPFQKFSDHLIGRYIFRKYEQEFGKENKNPQTAKKFFSKRKRLGKFLANSWNKGIIEALSIQCPEHLNGCELVEVAPYLKESHIAQEAFIESLIWRKPTSFSKDKKNTLGYIKEIIRTKIGRDNLLNAFLTIAPVPNHPFNADFLHRYLSRFAMPKRDSCWSTFLHYQYGKKGAVDRLIEWGWSDQDKSRINDESIRLCSVALCWFLSTPNRFLRDKATKALVALLTNRLSVVLELLKQFKDVNDPYVAERLYAVAYGCAIRSKSDKIGLKNLSQWVYDEIFNSGNPPVHILLRDYARGIIEVALKQKVSLEIDVKRIKPPFRTKWPNRFPTCKTIKKYILDRNFDYSWAQNSIIKSMQPEHSKITSLYGDFGRYVFQSNLFNFCFPKQITIQNLSNWATKEVFKLGYDVMLHGLFDENLDSYSHDVRSEHKPERIGKKYQWIALHKLLALASDHFQIKSGVGCSEGKMSPYEGTWQLNVRDIDPSCILKEFPSTRPENVPIFKWEVQNQYKAWLKHNSYLEWIKNSHDLPNPKKFVEVLDERGVSWVALEQFVEWQEETPPDREEYALPVRRLTYLIKSYLVRTADREKVVKWIKRHQIMKRWLFESREFYDVYLGEYPWMPSYLCCYNPYYDYNFWIDEKRGVEIPGKIFVTSQEYINSGLSLDCSIDGTIIVKLPSKHIVDMMGLTQNFVDGRFFDRSGEIVAFDPSVFCENAPNCVLIRKDKLCNFLKRGGYTLFWILQGEKSILGGESEQSHGWLKIYGLFILDEMECRIIGRKSSFYKI